MPIIAALRIRNEARWIERVIRSIQPCCARILVLDDRSYDGTPDICERLGCTVYRSTVPWVRVADGRELSDEAAGKDFLLQRAFEIVPPMQWNERSEWFMLAIDGDEELVKGDEQVLEQAITMPFHTYSLKILYLWGQENRQRVDGVYGTFARPSLFRLMNPAFSYRRTPFGQGSNFHCSSIPQEMLHHSTASPARLLHYGYLYREDRIRKYNWYNSIDPHNEGEDGYRHIVQGDVPEVPATARLRWAGPMEFQNI